MAAGCGGVQRLSFKNPPTSAAPAASTPVTLPNLTGVRQQPVDGVQASAPVVVGPGRATINGTVLGPAGAVAGATVQADRFVGDQFASTRTTTAADGSFSFAHVLGGRWRIRAWQPPSLDLTQPQVFFLGGSNTQTVTLLLNSFKTTVITGAMNPAPPVNGEPFNLVVQVQNPAVTADGVVAYAPVPGAPVTLVGGPEWQVTSANPSVTNGNGVAGFQVVCTATAPSSGLTAAVAGVGSQNLNVPACVAAPPVPPPT
ncbi:MAG: carboxypeptidase regulatory-like domain-containing protein, partial [Acidimicrobiaceae bacterium]|nr:carboxypeptidase regulatory-like domain-containing protein [Acidimicrobiaceae bacterium]